MDRFSFRLYAQGIPDLDDYDEIPAASSPDLRSSPSLPPSDDFEEPFLLLLSDDLPDDNEDGDYIDTVQHKKRRSPLTDVEKARLVLQFMRDTLSKFSLRQFLETIFKNEDAKIKNFANIFLADGGHLRLMDLWWEKCGGTRDTQMTEWSVSKAANACAREASWLSDRASEGPHEEDARFLRISSRNVDVGLVNGFRIFELLNRYERVTPHLQTIFKAVINKKKLLQPGSRDPDAVCSFLCMHSRLMNVTQILHREGY